MLRHDIGLNGSSTAHLYLSSKGTYMKLFEVNMKGILVYHGSMKDFGKFDITKIGSETKDLKGGWGIYFSDSREVAMQYTPEGNPIIKKYIIPKGDYFDLDEMLDEYFAQNIKNELENMEVSEKNIEEFQTDFIEYIPDISHGDVYDWLSHVLGSSKNASQFISDEGYVGNTFRDKTNRHARNYVMFDDKYIKPAPDYSPEDGYTDEGEY